MLQVRFECGHDLGMAFVSCPAPCCPAKLGIDHGRIYPMLQQEQDHLQIAPPGGVMQGGPGMRIARGDQARPAGSIVEQEASALLLPMQTRKKQCFLTEVGINARIEQGLYPVECP